MNDHYDPYEDTRYDSEASFEDARSYRSAAERRAFIEKTATKASDDCNEPLIPVTTKAKAVAKTFWGKAWCRHLNLYQDYEYRLPRGRAYLRDGGVIDLRVTEGKVDAMVVGHELYFVTINIERLDEESRDRISQLCSGELESVMELLAGKLSAVLLEKITDPDEGLFPDPQQIKFGCTCLDYADMCKHVAATMYGMAVRFDQNPTLFFELRGLEPAQLCKEVSTSFAKGIDCDALIFDEDELSRVFGIDLVGAAGTIYSEE